MSGEENNDAINSGSSLSFVCIQRSVSLIQTSHSTVTRNDFPSLLLCWCRLGASLCFFSQPAPMVWSPPSSVPLRGGPSIRGWAAPVWGAARPNSTAHCSLHSQNCGLRFPGEQELQRRLGPAAAAGLKRCRATQGQDSPSQQRKASVHPTELWAASLLISSRSRLDVVYWLPLVEPWMTALHRHDKLCDGFKSLQLICAPYKIHFINLEPLSWLCWFQIINIWCVHSSDNYLQYTMHNVILMETRTLAVL